MDTEKQLNFLCEKNSCNFFNSLRESYLKYGKLTERQNNALIKSYEKYISIQDKLKRVPENDFTNNLKKFFKERGFLTPKQEKALNKYSN